MKDQDEERPSYTESEQCHSKAKEMERNVGEERKLLEKAWAEKALAESTFEKMGNTWLDAEEEKEKLSEDLRRIQGLAQIVGDILRVLSPTKYVIRASNGARYVVGVRGQLLRFSDKLKVCMHVVEMG